MRKKKGILHKICVAGLCGLLSGSLLFTGAVGYQHYLTYQEQEEPDRIRTNATALGSNSNAVLTSNTSTENRVSSVLDVSGVWDSVIPSVVEIHSKIVTTYNFLGRIYEQESESAGTGIIVSSGDKLYLVTNHHVIDGATEVEVTFVDGTTASAELMGSNESEDVAVLAVDFSKLSESTLSTIKCAAIGNSDNLRCGEMVIAIGNANGQGLSLTVGYVSAVNREVEMENATMTLIQTDAAINPGNSGGPLLNAKGELVGINNAKTVETSVEGIGYAIPISSAITIINQILQKENIAPEESAYLGVECQDVTEMLSETLGIPVGVYVKRISEGSPAEAAGLPLYSVIVEVNGITVKNEEQLREVLYGIRGGSEGTIVVQERVNGTYQEREYKITFGYRSKSSAK